MGEKFVSGDVSEKSLDEFPKPSVTVDVIIFSIISNSLKVLLVKRKIAPFKDSWAIPGGFVDLSQSLEDAAKFKLEEKTGMSDVYLEQLYSFGDVNRDPRGRVITVAYFALVDFGKVKVVETSEHESNWFSVSSLPSLGFDHNKILTYAIQRLKWKFEYRTVAFSLLPEKFTMSQLQDLYEIVFSAKFDKRNFRKKILSLDILKERGLMKDVSFRPPMLYSLKKDVSGVINIL